MKLPFDSFNNNDITFPKVLNWKLNCLVDAFNNGTYKSITWEELYSLCQGEALIPGTIYRLTDYQCTAVENNSNAIAVNEGRFDILIVADNESTLNENVRFTYHDGDGYFAGCTLESWEGKYCIYNETTRFTWASKDNTGKGVIYWLKDEWGNECPYDFKNIQFKRIAITDVQATGITSEMLSDLKTTFVYDNNGGICYGQANRTPSNVSNGGGTINYIFDNNTVNYYYTFTWIDDSGKVKDASVVGQKLTNDDGYYSGVFNNQILPVSEYMFSSDNPNRFRIVLNNIVFVSSYSNGGYFNGYYGNKFGVNCYNNTFGNYCIQNTFGNDFNGNIFGVNCGNNTFGNDCYSNIFGDYCISNTFGNSCYRNTFGNNCDSNIFGNKCIYNIIGRDCDYNTFGNYCNRNTFGNSCWNNTFGNNCDSNIFGDYCTSNTFGNNCTSNTFGNYCDSNTFGNYCNSNTIENKFFCFNTFENGVSYCSISSGYTTSNSNYLQNIKFLSGDYQSFNIDELPIGINNCCVCGINSNSELVLANPVDYLIYGVNTNN
jgi:hypothetical protein